MSKHSITKSSKKQSCTKAIMKLDLVEKHYDFDLDGIAEPNPSELMDQSAWHEGAQKLASSMVMIVVSPESFRKRFVTVSAQIMGCLPKQISVQAARAAEDILNCGRSGHFVTLPGVSNEILRFDTSVQAAVFMAKNPKAFASSQGEIERHLVEKAEELEFLL